MSENKKREGRVTVARKIIEEFAEVIVNRHPTLRTEELKKYKPATGNEFQALRTERIVFYHSDNYEHQKEIYRILILVNELLEKLAFSNLEFNYVERWLFITRVERNDRYSIEFYVNCRQELEVKVTAVHYGGEGQ